MSEFDKDTYIEDDPTIPYWACSECDYENHNWAMPKDRSKFYASSKPRKCPKCHSESMSPVGWQSSDLSISLFNPQIKELLGIMRDNQGNLLNLGLFKR